MAAFVSLIASHWLAIAAEVVALPAGMVTILVVRAVEANQRRRHELRREQAATAPSPAAAAAAEVTASPPDDFPFEATTPEPWTPPDDEGEYPRFK